MDHELGRSPLQLEAPAGVDPREGTTFALLSEQMDKLTDIHSPGEPDWAQVADLSQRYLRTEAKDLAVACWMMAAWVRLHGTPGLVAGATVLNDLHRSHWDTMLPARVRARRNLMAWLIEWLGKTLNALDEAQLQPLEPEAHQNLLDAWGGLDDFLQEQDGDAPSLLALGARLRNLPVVQAAPEATAAETPAAGTPVGDTAAPAAPTHLPAPSVTAVMPVAPVCSPSDIHTAQDLETVVEKHLDALRPLLDIGVASHPTIPWVYLLTRTYAWGMLQVLPPATEDITRIPAPPQPEQDILDRLLSAQSPDTSALLQFTESRLPIYRFWLDLNYHSWKVLSGMPEGGAAATTVASEVSRLLSRLPGLERLSFANEQPFARPATRQWLAGLSVSGSAAATTAVPPSSPSDTLTLATAIAAASAQTAAAHALLATALERLENTAQQLHQRVATA